MSLKLMLLRQRCRIVNGSVYAEGLKKSAILAVAISIQRGDDA
jgi:hypothetical protein